MFCVSGFLVDKFGKYKPVVVMSLLLNALFHHSLMMIPQQEIPGKKLMNNEYMSRRYNILLRQRLKNINLHYYFQELYQLPMLCKY